ncbi:hypothetical protein ACQ4PT_069025 [Festuca glaucescens]
MDLARSSSVDATVSSTYARLPSAGGRRDLCPAGDRLHPGQWAPQSPPLCPFFPTKTPPPSRKAQAGRIRNVGKEDTKIESKVYLLSFRLWSHNPTTARRPADLRPPSVIRSPARPRGFPFRAAVHPTPRQAPSSAEMQKPGDFKLPPFFNYPPYFTLQPVRETREKQVQLWKDLILDYCRSQKMYIISLEEDFPLFSNPNIERSLSYEAKEVFFAALVSEGRAEWIDKSHKKCLILWLRIQDWANYILDFVRENGLEVTTIEDIRSGIETHGTELAGIDRGVLMRALKLLEQKGKATIFKGTSADDEGVKFSA